MKNKATLVGITGGIGAGKSLVCEIFSRLGASVYHADDRAKWLMAKDPELRGNIILNFGVDSFRDEELDRRYLAEHVFNDRTRLELLNSFVHPSVRKDFIAWTASIEFPYCLKEAALLFETGSHEELDMNILVYAPKSVRIQRVLQRDPFRTETEVRSIMDKQMDEERKKEMADHVLLNDGKTMILPEILKLHHELISSPFSGNLRSTTSTQ